MDSLAHKYDDSLVNITYHYDISAADINTKWDPFHHPLGKFFTMPTYGICGAANLGYQVDRTVAPNSNVKTTFAEALTDIEQYMDFTPVACSIAINHQFDAGTRALTGSVDIIFDGTQATGTYKLMLLVTQDSVVYKQYEYGMSSDFGVPYVDPAIGYHETWYHNHLLRDGLIVGDSIWGETLTPTPVGATTISLPINDVVPTRYPLDAFHADAGAVIPVPYDPEAVIDKDIILVAYVSYDDDYVVNAAKRYLNDVPTPVTQPIASYKTHVALSHINNTVSLTAPYEQSTLNLYSANGRKVTSLAGKITSGTTNFMLEASLAKGVYLLQIVDKHSNIIHSESLRVQ